MKSVQHKPMHGHQKRRLDRRRKTQRFHRNPLQERRRVSQSVRTTQPRRSSQAARGSECKRKLNRLLVLTWFLQEADVGCDNPLDGIYHRSMYSNYGSWEQDGNIWTDKESHSSVSSGTCHERSGSGNSDLESGSKYGWGDSE